MSDDDSIWTTSDKGLIKRYRQIIKAEVAAHNLMVEECTAGWNRLPVAYVRGAYWGMAGIALRTIDHDEREEAWREERRKAEPNRSYFGLMPKDDPPPGWRKRVKDDFFTPPLKGGGLDADFARELMRRYRSVPNARSLLHECGVKQVEHFEGLRLITPGVELKKGVIYVRSGKTFVIPDDRWQPMKMSEYLAVMGL